MIYPAVLSGNEIVGTHIRETIHVPGLRGNPERAYPVGAVGDAFPGTFENYAASVIAHWQKTKNEAKLRELSVNLGKLGLTWSISAVPISDTEVELRAGRLPGDTDGAVENSVNIADLDDEMRDLFAGVSVTVRS